MTSEDALLLLLGLGITLFIAAISYVMQRRHWAKPALPPPVPTGMRSVLCSRCNARQNIPLNDMTFECWQCKTVISR